MPFYQYSKEQKINTSIAEIWDFISSPANLKRITPDYMGFEIISDQTPEKMYPGMIISYTVYPIAGIKTKWVTEITHIKEMEYFVDVQRVGPYKLWHHQHFISPYKHGVVMKDLVTYQPPMGFIGGIANTIFIKKRLTEIFDYREYAIEKTFGAME